MKRLPFTSILSVSAPAVLSLMCLLAWAAPARGELTAGQVGILANRNSQDSLSVARHYAEARGIPREQIIELDMTAEDTIAREDYDQQVVRPTRQALEDRRLASKIRVLVTTYGMPLRIAAPRPTDQHRQWAADASDRLALARTRLDELESQLQRVAIREVIVRAEPKEPDDMRLERAAQAIRDAAKRLALTPDSDKAKEWLKLLVDSTIQFGGLDAFLRNSHPPANSEASRVTLNKLQQLVASTPAMIAALTDLPTDENRQRAYRLAELVFGLQGVIRLSKMELDTFSDQEADASFDSELSLLWWEADTYHLPGRTINPLHYERLGPESPAAARLPVLMVSRLDAPTPQLARQLVDQALAVEQHGLSGKVYVDAQGIMADTPFSTGYYDQSLRETAALFQKRTSHTVVLDNTERRFSSPGEAPDVAVYAGWYRLRSYEDAFTFTPGAMGYHIASGEAISIHDPKETGWCKNALQRGVAVTLGSTGEPLLDAFPPPDEFLGLLLTGRYSLVEAYYLTAKYVSWRMVLFGDPLYNPWRGKALAKTADLHLRPDAGAERPGLPMAPSEIPFPDPVQALQQLAAWRQTVLVLIDPVISRLSALSPKPSL